MASSLSGKVVAVTGAGSGIGSAVVKLLLGSGARVAALDVKWPQPILKDSSSQLTRTVDVSNEVVIETTFADIVRHFGRLDGLATCAGILNVSSFDALDAATFRRIHEVNVIGTFVCMKAAAARMSSGGRIVTVSSIAGIRGGGIFGTGAYAASKAAVIALTKNAARALGPKGIAVNCVAPGPTDTPINLPMEADPTIRPRLEASIALGRFAKPNEIGEAIVWLLSEQANYVSGATLVVDGGLTMM